VLLYTKVGNIFLKDDIHRVQWHPSGTFALLLGKQGKIARYTAETGALDIVGEVDGTTADIDVAPDGKLFLVVGRGDDELGRVWALTVGDLGAIDVSEVATITFGQPAAVVSHPDGGQWAIASRTDNSINYLFRYQGGAIIATKGYNGAGVRDVMWASPDLYAGSDSLVTSDGINGAGSSTWVIDSDMVVSNGWSPGFGNPGGAGWRPGGAYGVLCGNTSNVVYVYDGGWTKEYTPVANNGGITNAIAWRSDGGRALLVGRPTGSSLSGTVIDYRPSDATYFEPGAMVNAGIPGFDKPPWSANSNTHLLDVDFRPGACDAGLIVGADTGSAFSPTFGTVIYFQDSADSVCPSI